MKKKLNFITLLIGIAICIIIINSEEISLLKVATKEAFTEEKSDTHRVNNRVMAFYLEPSGVNMPSTLLNKKSGNLVPATISMAIVKVPIKKESLSNLLLGLLYSLIFFAGIIMIIFNFIKIIIAVNKSVIFEWVNVKRLRRIGVGFLILFIAGAFLMSNQNRIASEILELENYNMINASFDGSVLLLGMIAFLIGEIFSLGLKLKEEQEFTI